MLAKSLNSLILVGDTAGLPALLSRLPQNRIAAIIAARIRPQYIEEIERLGKHYRLPVLIQPKFNTLDYSEFIQQLAKLKPNGLLCYSYAMKIRPDVLEMVDQYAFNVHTSLLPKNRGPNPIQWSLIRGELETGVTLHQMSEEIDCGAIVEQRKVPIDVQDTWVTLRDKIVTETDRLLDEALPQLLSGDYALTPQDEGEATTNFRLTPDYPVIDFKTMDDETIFNLIRAQVKPLSGAYIPLPSGERVIVDEWKSIEKVSALRQQYNSKLAGV